jgi:hypothetical protein
MEVMGLMLGGFVDDYTVRVVDVRSFPPPFPAAAAAAAATRWTR